MKTEFICRVTRRAYNIKKIFNDFSQLPRSAEYNDTIYICNAVNYLPMLYDIYITPSGKFYARLIT